MLDWLLGGDFLPRSQCGNWEAWLVNVNIIANCVIAFAYFLIPLALWALYRRRKSVLPRSWMLLCFCAFITLCGFTHVADVLSFWYAPYRAFTLLSVMTALVSLFTAFLLPGTVKYLCQYKTPAEYEAILTNRDALLTQKTATIEALKMEVWRASNAAELLKERNAQRASWYASRSRVLNRLLGIAEREAQ